MFKHWLLKYHPGVLLVPVQRTAGSRQDLATEGAGAAYWNRIHYVEFLDECLRSGNDNILQENLFVVLTFIEILYASEMACWKHAIHWTTRIQLANEINGKGD